MKYILLQKNLYLALIVVSIISLGWEKTDKKVESDLTPNTFIQKTQFLIRQNHYSGLASEIDFSTTKFINNESKGIFYTKLRKNSQFIRALVSIVRSDNKVLNYIVVIDKLNDSTFNNFLFTLSGKKFAEFGIQSNQFSESVFFDPNSNIKQNDTSPSAPVDFVYPFDGEEYIPDPEMLALASWWSCTKECISDAHIACYLDRDCISLLLVVNAASGVAVPKIAGIGSVSIGIACGVVCAGNSSLDMLPQY